MGESTGFQTQEEHYYAADNGDDADPIDGFDAGDKRCSRMFEFEEEEEHDESKAVNWEVDVELKEEVSQALEQENPGEYLHTTSMRPSL